MVEKHVCPGPRTIARRWDGVWQFGEEHPFTGRELAIDPLPAEAVSRVRLRVDPFDPDPEVESELQHLQRLDEDPGVGALETPRMAAATAASCPRRARGLSRVGLLDRNR